MWWYLEDVQSWYLEDVNLQSQISSCIKRGCAIKLGTLVRDKFFSSWRDMFVKSFGRQIPPKRPKSSAIRCHILFRGQSSMQTKAGLVVVGLSSFVVVCPYHVVFVALFACFFSRDFAHRCHGLRGQSALGKASLGILWQQLSLCWACDLCLGKIYPEALIQIFIQKAWHVERPCKQRENHATSFWLHSWDCQMTI